MKRNADWILGFWLPLGMTTCLPLLTRVHMPDGTSMALAPDPSLPFVSISRHISAPPAAGAWGMLMGGAMSFAWTGVARPLCADRLCAALFCTHCALFALLLVPEAIGYREHQIVTGILMTGATWYAYEAWRRHETRPLYYTFVACSVSFVGVMCLAFLLTLSFVIGYAYFLIELVLLGACLAIAPLATCRAGTGQASTVAVQRCNPTR